MIPGSSIRPSAMAGACAVVVAFMIASCDDTTGPPPTGPTITIVPVEVTVFEGDSVRLTARVFDNAGVEVTTAPVAWSVDDTTLARFVHDDVLSLLQPGTVRITARSGTASATYDLAIGRLVVERVELTPQTVSMARTDHVIVAARALGQGDREIAGRTAAFTSDDELVVTIAAVTSNGRAIEAHLIAEGAGSTTIRATVDGVTGTAHVDVVDLDTTFVLTEVNGSQLPVFVAADSVEFDGVKELDEVYADGGKLVLSGLLQKRYQLEVVYSQYHVITMGDSVRRELRLRVPGEIDHGRATPGANGSLSMLSEFIGPHLEHTATLQADGYLVHYRIPGESSFLDLRYARVTPLQSVAASNHAVR